MFTFTRLISTMLAVFVVAIVLAPVVHLLGRVAMEPMVLLRVASDPVSWALLGRSLMLAGVVSATSIALGTALAWLTVRPTWPGAAKLALTVVLCSSLVIPSYVMAFGLIAATGTDGLMSSILPSGFHVRDMPLLSSWAVLVCCTYPYVLLTVRGTLLRECGSLEEAALSVGASRWRAFRTVTLPRIAPGMVWGGMLAGLYALSDFGAVSLLGYETLTWGIYSRYDTAFGMEQARVLCFMLAMLTIALIALMRLVQPELTMSTSAAPLAQSRVRLRWSAAPAAFVIALPLAVGVLIPVSAIVQRLAGSAGAGDLFAAAGPAAMRTLWYALVAAMFVPALALPIASMHLGRGRRAGRVLTPLTLIGFALPGIVIAIAGAGLALQADAIIEWLFNWPMKSRLYQSHLVVLLAYATLFLPEAAGPMRSSASRVHPEQLDAAAQLGSGAFGNWWRIALPQMAPGLAAGAALVFVTTAKELPATLILAPPNVQTLATRLWGAMEEAYFAQAAAAAVLLLLVGAGGLVTFLLLERIGRTPSE